MLGLGASLLKAGAEYIQDETGLGENMDYAEATKKLKDSKAKLDEAHHDLIDNLKAEHLEAYDASTMIGYGAFISDLKDFMENPEEIEELQDELLDLQEWMSENNVMAQAQMGGGDTAPEAADSDDAPEDDAEAGGTDSDDAPEGGGSDSVDPVQLETAPETPIELARALKEIIDTARTSGNNEVRTFTLEDGTSVELIYNHQFSQVEVETSEKNDTFEQNMAEAVKKLPAVSPQMWTEDVGGKYEILLDVKREAPARHPEAIEWKGDAVAFAEVVKELADGPKGNSKKLFHYNHENGYCIIELAKMQDTGDIQIMLSRDGATDDSYDEYVQKVGKMIVPSLQDTLGGNDNPALFKEKWTNIKTEGQPLFVYWLLDSTQVGDIEDVEDGVEDDEVVDESNEAPEGLTDTIDEHDFWRRGQIIEWEPSDDEGVKGYTKIPIGTKYLHIKHRSDGLYVIENPFGGQNISYGDLDEALHDAAQVQRLLGEVTVGRWHAETSTPFVIEWGTGKPKFDPVGGNALPTSQISAFAAGAAVLPMAVGGYMAGATAGALTSLPTTLGVGLIPMALAGGVTGATAAAGTTLAVPMIYGNDAEGPFAGDSKLLADLMNDWYQDIVTARGEEGEKKKIERDESIDERIYDAIEDETFWNAGHNIEISADSDGVTKIDVSVNQAKIELKGSVGSSWVLEAGGVKINCDDMDEAMEMASLMENLLNEVASGKYELEEDFRFGLSWAGYITFGDGDFADMEGTEDLHIVHSTEIQLANPGKAHFFDREMGHQVVEALNALYEDAQKWEMPEPEEKKDEKKEDEDKKKEEDVDDKDREEGRTDDSDGGGGDGGRDTAGGDDHSHGGGGGSHGGGAERGRGRSGGRTGGGLEGGQDTTRKPDDAEDKEEDDDAGEEAGERPPTDEERYETHKSLTVLNALAQTAFGRNKDYRARIMRKMRKCRRGKAEGREGRTKYPVIRLTKMEIKDGHVTMSFADSVSDSGNVITYTAAAENPKPDSKSSAGKINYEGVEFKNTASNREALKALFKGSIFKFKERPSYVRTDILGSGPAEAALDTKEERKALKNEWSTMKDNIKDYIKGNSKARVCFGSRIPVIMNKNVKMRYKGKNVKLNLVLDYERDDDGGRVTLKVKDESGKIYPNWKAGVDDAISTLGASSSGGRTRGRGRKKKR